MKKIQYTIYTRETGNASGKAKKDCLETLEELGFCQLYNPSSIRFIRVLQQFVALNLLGVRSNKKVFVVQYPAVHEKLYSSIKRGINEDDVSILIIHDLLALQNDLNGKILKEEIKFFRKFNYIIVPNQSMLRLLKENGYNGSLVNMEIYDYLHDNKRLIKESSFANRVCFAGNLKKSIFLNKLHDIKNVKFLLYGKDGNNLRKDNVIYKGCLDSNELIYEMEGDYGLVWDGDSLEGCTGTVGRYLLYNSPHKLSAYIAAGKPVITWEEAAISEYVKKYDIGICIKSIRELEYINLEKNYFLYKSNVMELKNKLAHGFYLKKAINSILEVI